MQPPALLGHELDRFLDVVDGLLPHARQLEDAPVVDDPQQVIDRLDALLVPHQLDRFGPEPGDLKDFHQPLGDLIAEFVVLADGPVLRQLDELAGRALADALQGHQGLGIARLGQRFDVLGRVLEHSGGLGVRTDTEAIAAQQLDHLGHLIEHGRRGFGETHAQS